MSPLKIAVMASFGQNIIMKKNMGAADRILRILIAIVIGILYFTHVVTGTLGIVLMVIAAIFLLTSIISVCPLYSMLGISTCPRKQRNKTV